MFRKKFIGFSLIILILIVGIGVVSAQDNTTQILENSTAAPTDEGKTFTDIQKQIDAASENATIELEGNYASEGKEIQINKTLTITSKNGATLNANQKSAIFNISNVNVCLNNLNLINSKSDFTSAIYNQGNLTISNTNFINNTVHIENIYYSFDSEYDTIGYTAGAIYSTNALTIINSTFENNFAIRDAYEIEYFEYYTLPWGGSIYSKGTLNINKSRFREDDVDSFGNLTVLNSEFIASGVNCHEKSSIINSTFTKNPDYSAAIKTSTDLNITGCNFTDNGGYVVYGEYTGKCTIIINECNFINNNLKCAGCYDYEADEDELNSESPTVFFDGPDIYVYKSNFVNNTESAIESHTGNLYVLDSSFSKNSAYSGGAIASSNATVINSTFTDNYANFAGAIYSNTLFLQNCNFTNNNEAAIGIAESATINNQTYNGHKYFDNTLNELKVITASVGKLTTTYQSGKTLQAKFTYTETKHPVKNTWVDLKIIKGKKVYYDDVWVNSKGIANYKASNLAVGTYKIIFNYDGGDLPKITTTVKITKAKTIIKAPKVTNKYKKSRYFKVTVKNKATKKAVKNTYVKVKIDKKTYKIKTNSKGIAKLNTKKLKIGKHKVTITSGNTNYVMSAKSTIIIKK